MGKFKKGLFLGGLLGAGLTWMNTTKKGRKTRDGVLDHAALVYKRVVDEVKASKQWDTMTKSEFSKTVQGVVDKYAIQNGLADSAKNMIVKVVRAQWGRVKKEVKKKKKKK